MSSAGRRALASRILSSISSLARPLSAAVRSLRYRWNASVASKSGRAVRLTCAPSRSQEIGQRVDMCRGLGIGLLARFARPDSDAQVATGAWRAAAAERRRRYPAAGRRRRSHRAPATGPWPSGPAGRSPRCRSPTRPVPATGRVRSTGPNSACGRTRRSNAPARGSSRRCRCRVRARRSPPPSPPRRRPKNRPAYARGSTGCESCHTPDCSSASRPRLTGTLVLPNTTAPAACRRCTASASSCAALLRCSA